MVRLRVRIRFTKQGDLRFIGHRDLMRCFERVFRRAGPAMGFSRGFHPKPRMTFPSPLAVGIEGDDEVMEVELAESTAAEELLRRLSPHAPPGLAFRAAEVPPPGAGKARLHAVKYEVRIPPPPPPWLDRRIEQLLAAEAWPFIRPNGRRIDLRPLVRELAFSDNALSMRLGVGPGGGAAGPRDVLAALGLDGIENRGARLRRTAVEIKP